MISLNELRFFTHDSADVILECSLNISVVLDYLITNLLGICDLLLAGGFKEEEKIEEEEL